MFTRTATIRWFAISALVAVAGCGGGVKLPEVTGAVAIDGTPVEKGAISFIPANGQGPTTGSEIVAGKYTSKAPLGECKVEIRVSKVVGTKKLYDTPDSPIQDILEEVLPEKYNDASELRFDAKPGQNQKNWDLSLKLDSPA